MPLSVQYTHQSPQQCFWALICVRNAAEQASQGESLDAMLLHSRGHPSTCPQKPPPPTSNRKMAAKRPSIHCQAHCRLRSREHPLEALSQWAPWSLLQHEHRGPGRGSSTHLRTWPRIRWLKKDLQPLGAPCPAQSLSTPFPDSSDHVLPIQPPPRAPPHQPCPPRGSREPARAPPPLRKALSPVQRAGQPHAAQGGTL